MHSRSNDKNSNRSHSPSKRDSLSNKDKQSSEQCINENSFDFKNKEKRKRIISDSDSDQELKNNDQETAEYKEWVAELSQKSFGETKSCHTKGKRLRKLKGNIDQQDDMSISSDSSEMGLNSMGSAFKPNPQIVNQENDNQIKANEPEMEDIYDELF